MGFNFFLIRAIRVIRGFQILKIEICLGFGAWDLGFRATTQMKLIGDRSCGHPG
jgi:hypothetical protein